VNNIDVTDIKRQQTVIGGLQERIANRQANAFLIACLMTDYRKSVTLQVNPSLGALNCINLFQNLRL